MKTTELAFIIFTVVIFVTAGTPESNCNKFDNKYRSFVRKHILREDFDRNSLQAWESYLKIKQLWNRTPIQSFMEKNQNVEDICTTGQRVQEGKNLFISQSKILVYEVITKNDNNGCRIQVDPPIEKHVVVACVKVGNHCLPVHFQGTKT